MNIELFAWVRDLLGTLTFMTHNELETFGAMIGIILDDLETRGVVPIIAETNNTVTPHHKITFLFFNSRVREYNQNDEQVSIGLNV